MSRVELFESICRDARHQGMGIRCLGPDLPGASAHGPPGPDERGAARTETFGAGGAGAWAVEAVDPHLGDRRPGAPQEAAAHRPAGCWQRLVDGYGAELGWVDRQQLRRPSCVES